MRGGGALGRISLVAGCRCVIVGHPPRAGHFLGVPTLHGSRKAPPHRTSESCTRGSLDRAASSPPAPSMAVWWHWTVALVVLLAFSRPRSHSDRPSHPVPPTTSSGAGSTPGRGAAPSAGEPDRVPIMAIGGSTTASYPPAEPALRAIFSMDARSPTSLAGARWPVWPSAHLPGGWPWHLRRRPCAAWRAGPRANE